MHSTGRRLKAARALGGFSSPQALAAQVRMPNLSGRNMREVESDRRALHPHEAEAVARACGLDPAFFTVDLSDLAGDDGDALMRAQSLLREALSAAEALERARAKDDASPASQGHLRPVAEDGPR